MQLKRNRGETFIKDSYSEFNDLWLDAQRLKEKEENIQFKIQQEERFGTINGSMVGQVILMAIIYLIIVTLLIIKYRLFLIKFINGICSKKGPERGHDQETRETAIQMETMAESNDAYERENASYYTTLRSGN